MGVEGINKVVLISVEAVKTGVKFLIFLLSKKTNYLLVSIILNLDLIANIFVEFVSLILFCRPKTSHVLEGDRLAVRNIDVSHVKSLTLSFIFCLYKLSGNVRPIAHTALHDTLH